jgi:uncharacterized protein (DUF2147 family)
MKKIILLLTVLIGATICSFAQNGDAVKGIWINDNKDAKMEIYRSGDKYYGKVIWTDNMYESDGRTLRKDEKNSDDVLKNRTIQNMIILSGFTYNDGEWTGGEIYNPKTGKTYKSTMKLSGRNLEIRGYVGIFSKTTTWVRIS